MNPEKQRRRLAITLIVVGLSIVAVVLVPPWQLSVGPLLLFISAGFILFGTLGLLGVNVFRGGPLDRRLDAETELPDPEHPLVLTFQQKRGLQRRRFDLYPTFVDVTWSTPVDHFRYRVPLEAVLRHPTEFTEQRDGLPIYRSVLMGLGLFFGFIAMTEDSQDVLIGGLIACVFCLSLAALNWLLEHFPRKNVLAISAGDPTLILFADRPSEKAVQEFIKEVQGQASRQMRGAYGTERSEKPLEAIERIFALFQQGAISEDEFRELKAIALTRRDEEQNDSDDQVLH